MKISLSIQHPTAARLTVRTVHVILNSPVPTSGLVDLYLERKALVLPRRGLSVPSLDLKNKC